MAFVVLYDANVLYPSTLRDLLIRIAQAGLARARRGDQSPAQAIVTNNLKDFPPAALDPWDMEAKPPDHFLLDQIDLSRETVLVAVQRMADSYERPPASFADVLARLESDGLVETSAALRQ